MTGRATLLRELLRRRRLTREQLLSQLVKRAASMGLGDEFVAPSVRSLDRWLAGDLRTLPHSTTCRVLEAEFGHTVEQLLGPYGRDGETGDHLDEAWHGLQRLQAAAGRIQNELLWLQQEIELMRSRLRRSGTQPALDEEANPWAGVVRKACQIAGLPAAGAHPVDEDSWLLPGPAVVATVLRGTGATVRSRIAVLLSQHLAAHGVPVVEPVPVPSGREMPIVDIEIDVAVTFWRHTKPATGRESLAAAVDALRAVREAPPPPVPLPRYRPLVGLVEQVAEAQPAAAGTRSVLTAMVGRIQERYERLRPQLREGVLHGETGIGLRGEGSRVLLGDWRQACLGPPELDLVRLVRGRMGTGPQEMDQAVARYGIEVRDWPGYQLACAIVDCASLVQLGRGGATVPAGGGELDAHVDRLWRTYRGCRW